LVDARGLRLELMFWWESWIEWRLIIEATAHSIFRQEMILLSSSAAIRKAYHIKPVQNTPPVRSDEWFRFWRVDACAFKDGPEVMLFTNHETLYTFVADASGFRSAPDWVTYFARRYSEMFHPYFGYNGRVTERFVVHKASDRSVIGVMNSHFNSISFYANRMSVEAMEDRVNRTPIVSRKIFPADSLAQKLKEARH